MAIAGRSSTCPSPPGRSAGSGAATWWWVASGTSLGQDVRMGGDERNVVVRQCFGHDAEHRQTRKVGSASFYRDCRVPGTPPGTFVAVRSSDRAGLGGLRVFCISVATVIGPTPPGTGSDPACPLRPRSRTARPRSGDRRQPVDADVDHHRARLHPVAQDQAGRPTATTRMSASPTYRCSVLGRT